MPIYEYQCSNCGHQLEIIQKVNDDPLADCPQCNTATLRRVVSPVAFHLKGTGWYVTDFKDKGKAGSGAPEDKKSGTEKPKTDSSADKASSSNLCTT